MLLSIKIALRFLKSAKGQTILITLGIAIGVSVQIFIGLLIQGLQTSLIDKTIGSSPHITISAEANDGIADYERIMQDLEAVNGLKAVTAVLDNPALIDINDAPKSILIRGFTLEGADLIYKLNNSLIEGSLPSNDNTVIIGKSIYEQGGYTIGDEITVAQNKALVISGVFDLKVSAINNSWFITNITTAQNLYSQNWVSSIQIQINDVFASDVIAEEISKSLEGNELQIVDWQSQNAELLSGLSGQNISSIMIQVFVLVAVVLGIASVLAISVLQKSKQIGILKAMGIKDSASSIIFLTQGFVLGILGAIAGIILGLGLSIAFSSFALNPDGTPLIPLAINMGFILFSALIAIIASMLASLIPAIRSLKMDPIEVIKNG